MKNTFKPASIGLAVLLLITACKKSVGPNDGNNTLPETQPPVQQGVTTDVNANIGGYLEALPARYDSTNLHYPLLVFLHGLGELGNGASQLNNVAKNAVPSLIKNKKFPPAFTANGQSFSFIVLSPQFKDWPSSKDVNDMIDYAIDHYRVDSTRIYVTGLSMGGGVTWEYAMTYGTRIAAIVPICGASYPNDEKAQLIAQANVPVWAFHNEDDGTVPVSYSKDYVAKINSFHPDPPARLTLWPTGGHNAWTKASDPNYKENGMNMYEWMLQYTRTGK